MSKKLLLLVGLVLALVLLVTACTTGQEGNVIEKVTEGERIQTPTGPVSEEITYERSETLYTSGTQWGPPAGYNPWNLGNYATGTFGLMYEPMFIYDPLADEFMPWLAESGEWTSDAVYQVKLRQGIQWSDGEPFTAADVKFTFDAAQEAPVSISPVWNFLGSANVVDDYTVTFTFDRPLYQRWSNYLYTAPIVPRHIWESKSVEEITSGLNENPIGTGSYLAESYDQTKVVWVKNEQWWGKKLLGLDPKPKRIIDLVNSSNNVALGLVMQGGLDLSNHFLPGIATLLESGSYGNLQTYYPGPPYMLSANTAWLLMNSRQAPMDDVAFRRAMAFAIDTDQIVNNVYGKMVVKANPTGLLPVWDEYVDQDVVDEFGFSYDPDIARQILADAGYEDVDGDGFVEAPDGSPVELSVICPSGWTDWMEAIRVISAGAQAVGINLTPDFPDYAGYLDQRNQGTFEMILLNDAQVSNTPWTYYNWIYQNPIEDIATIQNGNYGRYDNPEVFALVDRLDQTPTDDLDGMREVISELQRVQLVDMPLIPLWYNGMWSQVSTAYWTNWPSSAEGANHWLPVSWRGYWNMTAIRMLTDLEPVEQTD